MQGDSMAYDLKDIKSYVTGCHMMRDGALERGRR